MMKSKKKTVLGVSLIHGRLQVLAVVKDQVIGQWESPELIENDDQLQSALSEAVRMTQYSGQKVSFLVEDERFIHQYLQVPVMKSSDLRLYLTNMVDEMTPWSGPSVWRFRTTKEARGKMGVLLDIWPQEFVDGLVRISQELELTPTLIVPMSATFIEQVRSLPLEDEDIVLLVTLMPNKIVLLVAKGDGTPLFERFLSPTCDGVNVSERIGHEVTRSILFCAQQFRINVSHIWLFGESSDISLESIQPKVGLPIKQSPMNTDPAYCIWVSLQLPIQSPCNFTSMKVRLAPLQKAVLKFTAAAVVGFFILGVGLTSFLQGRLVRAQGHSLSLASQSSELSKEKHVWQSRIDELNRQEARSQHIMEHRLHPLPGWLLGYLGNELPLELTLTQTVIARVADEWKIELKGMAPGDLVIGSQTLALFETRLREGPFHVDISSDWREVWLQEVSGEPQQDAGSPLHQFSMHGRIQG